MKCYCCTVVPQTLLATCRFSIPTTVTDTIKARETQVSPTPLFLLTVSTTAVCVGLIPQFLLLVWTHAHSHSKGQGYLTNLKGKKKNIEEYASIQVSQAGIDSVLRNLREYTQSSNPR